MRIVGEDEADPATGSISHAAPLARALLGARIGKALPPLALRTTIVVVGLTAFVAILVS